MIYMNLYLFNFCFVAVHTEELNKGEKVCLKWN